MSPSRPWLLAALSAAVGMAAAFAIGEVAVRVAGEVDAHGTFHLGGQRIPPYRYDGRVYQEQVDGRIESGSSTLYDPRLGWAYLGPEDRRDLPETVRGIYGDTVHAQHPEEGRLRIVLVGDSFTRGIEVGYYDTWGYVLQQRMRDQGLDVEVLNLGVGGYGIDQAYLRWTGQGRDLAPDLVILGFQPENLMRGLNVFRPYYAPGTALVFSKPRFVLDGDSLAIRNLPPVPPDSIATFVDHFGEHPLSALEAFRRPDDERVPAWRRSRLLSSLVTVGRRQVLGVPDHPESDFFGSETEAGRIGLRLADRFEREARTAGASFVLLHLPRPRVEVTGAVEGRPVGYAELFAILADRHDVVDPLQALASAAGPDGGESLAMPGGHYSPEANRVVGEVAADALVQWLRDGTLRVGRPIRGLERPGPSDASPGNPLR